MKNIPRVFVEAELAIGREVPLSDAEAHYLTRVMRTDRFLAFNNGDEFEAAVIPGGRCKILAKTGHSDPSGKWVFCFAPVKRIEDLIAGAVQMGAGVLQPVITERTIARHVNWERMRRVIIENAEQSGRNSLPELLPPIFFADLEKRGLVYGDERKINQPTPLAPLRKGGGNYSPRGLPPSLAEGGKGGGLVLFVGPEGGFSDAEFDALDNGGAIGVGLGSTILRAEVAAVALAALFKSESGQ